MRVRMLVIAAVVALTSVGCFGNTRLIGVGGTGIFASLNPAGGLVLAAGRLDIQVLDTDLLNEKLTALFSTEGSIDAAQLYGIELLPDGEQNVLVGYSSLQQVEILPIYENRPETWEGVGN